ncbi:MAG: hypothetical protein VW397_08010 [Candidatus Margulisiibacteriota bacterium]
MKQRYLTLFLIFFITVFPCLCLGAMAPKVSAPQSCHAMSHEAPLAVPDADCQHCYVKDQLIKDVDYSIDSMLLYVAVKIPFLFKTDYKVHSVWIKSAHFTILHELNTIRLIC